MIIKSQRIGIGTAQWGFKYGVSNTEGQTTEAEAIKILDVASQRGINLIDTAALYGDSEEVLGRIHGKRFNIVTKTPHFNTSTIDDTAITTLYDSFDQSKKRLGVSSVYGLLLHNASDVLKPGGENLVKALNQLKEEGRVMKIGFSAYERAQIVSACSVFKPDLVQIPLSIVDQRLILDGTLESLASKGIEIHARSIFLQGLLLMDATEIPNYFVPWKRDLLRWHEYCADMRLSPQTVALSWACQIPEVSRVVIGMQNSSQIEEICSSDLSIPLEGAEFLANSETGLINPSLWRL